MLVLHTFEYPQRKSAGYDKGEIPSGEKRKLLLFCTSLESSSLYIVSAWMPSSQRPLISRGVEDQINCFVLGIMLLTGSENSPEELSFGIINFSVNGLSAFEIVDTGH